MQRQSSRMQERREDDESSQEKCNTLETIFDTIGELAIVLHCSPAERVPFSKRPLAIKVSLLFVPRSCMNMRWQPSAKKR